MTSFHPQTLENRRSMAIATADRLRAAFAAHDHEAIERLQRRIAFFNTEQKAEFTANYPA